MDGAVDDLTNSGKLEAARHKSQAISYMCSLNRDTKEAAYKGNTGLQREERSVEFSEGDIGDPGRGK